MQECPIKWNTKILKQKFFLDQKPIAPFNPLVLIAFGSKLIDIKTNLFIPGIGKLIPVNFKINPHFNLHFHFKAQFKCFVWCFRSLFFFPIAPRIQKNQCLLSCKRQTLVCDQTVLTALWWW